MRALVCDYDEPARAEPGDRYLARAIAGRDDLADAERPQLVQLRAAVVRVVAQLVEDLRLDRAHDGATVGPPSDTRDGSEASQVLAILAPGAGSAVTSTDVACVLVHIDLDGTRACASSLIALAAGRQLASSWGATLYAALIAHDPDAQGAADTTGKILNAAKVPGIEELETQLAQGGADKIVVALTDAVVAPLWAAVGTAWQGVIDHLRPRLVLFGADAPSAAELAPRTGARIGARLLLRARTTGGDEVELRDRDGGYVRASDGGAAVALIGRASEVPHGDEDIDVVVLALPGGVDERIEIAGSTPAEVAHTLGAVVVIGDDAAKDPKVVANASTLAQRLGGVLVGGADAVRGGAVAAGGVVDRTTPLAPELCVMIGGAQADVAGATSLIKIGAQPGKLVDGALPGTVDLGLAALVERLEDFT